MVLLALAADTGRGGGGAPLCHHRRVLPIYNPNLNAVAESIGHGACKYDVIYRIDGIGPQGPRCPFGP
jgi:hypothetical protein